MKARIVGCLRNFLLLALTAVSFLNLKPPGVFAHAELLSADPAPGEVLPAAPDHIRLTFNEPVTADSAISLIDADFRSVTDLNAQQDPQTPEQLFAVVPDLAPGEYTVQWSAVSSDGHRIQGSYSFTITPATEPGPAAPWWLSRLLAAAVLLLIGFLWRWWRLRSN